MLPSALEISTDSQTWVCNSRTNKVGRMGGGRLYLVWMSFVYISRDFYLAWGMWTFASQQSVNTCYWVLEKKCFCKEEAALESWTPWDCAFPNHTNRGRKGIWVGGCWLVGCWLIWVWMMLALTVLKTVYRNVYNCHGTWSPGILLLLSEVILEKWNWSLVICLNNYQKNHQSNSLVFVENKLYMGKRGTGRGTSITMANWNNWVNANCSSAHCICFVPLILKKHLFQVISFFFFFFLRVI